MTRILSLVLLLSLAFASATSAQTVQEISDTTLFSIRQESIPAAPDSGGKWIPLNILITNKSAYPVHVPGFQTHSRIHDYGGTACSSILGARLADSAWLIADSVFICEDVISGHTLYLNHSVVHGSPWKYKDSVMSMWPGVPDTFGQSYRTIDGNAYHGLADVEFAVPPHETLRVPYLVQAIGTENIHQLDLWPVIFDFQDRRGIQYWFSDSADIRRMGDSGEYQVRPYPFWLSVMVPAPCSGPTILFDSTTLTNILNPVVIGGSPYSWSRYSGWPNDSIIQTTRVSFKLVGEYSDRFIVPGDVTIYCRDWAGATLTFNGAPKPVVLDTLISTSTDSWGTVVTRTPIEAYTTIKNGYKMRALQTNMAPFLGSAYDTVVVSNVSDFPVEVKDLQFYKYSSDPEDFRIVSAPSVIASHDSGYIILLLTDNNKAKDTSNNYKSVYLTGVVAPYQSDMGFTDSVFQLGVYGKIDIWCPVNTIYTDEKPPKLKHGIHPTGIIFPSDVSSTFTGPSSFEIRFGNFDSVSEYFYTPYFDDSRFQIALGNYDGLGTLPVPGLIPPAQYSSQICAKISYIGDDYHNYLTQLHWPRANDTVTIDVMAIGVNAPPISGVDAQTSSSSFSIWPNPASSLLHIIPNGERASFAIYDIFGREVYAGEASSSAAFDISKLSTGFYTVVLGSKTGHVVGQKLAVIR